jgi:hypothetical protein
MKWHIICNILSTGPSPRMGSVIIHHRLEGSQSSQCVGNLLIVLKNLFNNTVQILHKDLNDIRIKMDAF